MPLLEVLQALLAPYASWFGRPRVSAVLAAVPVQVGVPVAHEVSLGLDGLLRARTWSSSAFGVEAGGAGVVREVATSAEVVSPRAAGELVGDDWNLEVLVDVFLSLPAPQLRVLLGRESVRS